MTQTYVVTQDFLTFPGFDLRFKCLDEGAGLRYWNLYLKVTCISGAQVLISLWSSCKVYKVWHQIKNDPIVFGMTASILHSFCRIPGFV